MKNEWNKRALTNPYHYISTFREKWDDDSFYMWGEIQTQSVIDRFLEKLNIDPSEKNMLEIGCGAGRMTHALASRFKSVYAYDVSDHYIQIAKEKNSHRNVFFSVNDGLSFPEIDDQSIDFVFSGWTMYHMPTKKVVIKNIEEMARMLRREGLYKIDPRITTSSRFKELAISRARAIVLPFLKKDKLKSTPTFEGVSFAEKELVTIISRYGLSVNTLMEEDGSERFYGKRVMKKWLYGNRLSI